MDFRLTEEQELLVATARALFTNECPPRLVRAVADDPELARTLFDRHLRDWVGLAAPPPDGSQVDLSLFLAEAGAVVAPGPFLATAGLFVPLLAAAGHELADDAALGTITGTAAVAGSDGVWLANDDPVRTQVIDLDLVEHVAIVFGGPRLAVLPVEHVSSRVVETLDLARQYSTFEVEGALGSEVAAVAIDLDPAALQLALDRAAVSVAAELVGVTRWLLDASVAYAKQRVQFGKPIGSFQAIQHKLVDMALGYEEAAAAVAHASMTIDADDADRGRAVHVAKAVAGQAARRAGRDGLQVHGGIGYTWEHDLHLRLRRAFADDALVGVHEWHLDRLADLLIDGDTDAGAVARARSAQI
jgi:alkylation response protein AidB-like acyl-CoA dehydrogenase